MMAHIGKIYMRLHKLSKQEIEETFARYTTVETGIGLFELELNGRVLIHTYPVRDTRDNKGELDGYVDSLIFRVDIYNVVRKSGSRKEEYLKYVAGEHDGITFHCSYNQFRHFKDGSGMFILEGPLKITLWHDMEVESA